MSDSAIRRRAIAVLCGLWLAAPSAPAETAHARSGDPARSDIGFLAQDPAELESARAAATYQELRHALGLGYARSGDRTASAYQGWRRCNRVPYRSPTHGERYGNSYANPLARDYGRSNVPKALPAGAILAKDSFALTAEGEPIPGPLFIMEKMPPGFAPWARDWRYSMIMPDGSVFGVTGGQGSERVGFCVPCHRRAGDDADHLFFVPANVRR